MGKDLKKIGSHKGFQNFVSSLLQTKPSKSPAEKVSLPPTTIPTPIIPQKPTTDADLLKLLVQDTQQTGKQKESADHRQNSLGLGADTSSQKVSQISQLQQMKEKYVKKPVQKGTQSQQPKQFVPELSRSLITKKITKTSQDQIIDQRKLKLQKKVDQREAAVKKEKEIVEQEVKPESKQHFLKRNLKKTRSKQKNRRKDTRPPEVLQKKFGSILNV